MALQVRRPTEGGLGLSKLGSAAGIASLFGGKAGKVFGKVAGGAEAAQGIGAGMPEPRAQPGTGGAINRRLTGVNDDIMAHIQTFQAAEKALPNLPPEVRADVIPPLYQTMARIAQSVKSRQGAA